MRRFRKFILALRDGLPHARRVYRETSIPRANVQPAATAAPSSLSVLHQGQMRSVHCRGALERHRLIKVALRERPLRPDAHVVHFAAEASVAAMVPRKNYRSASNHRGAADLILDMTGINLPSKSVNAFVANHVLEHILDDRRALKEVLRVLKPRGVFIATVSIIEGWDHTYEDENVTSDEGRALHFGQHDHVRYYGRDFRDRVKDTGFDLFEFVGSGADCARYALIRLPNLFGLCRRYSCMVAA